MKVHIIEPYSTEGNLGKAYNEEMARIPDGDWACIKDLDTMFLTPDAGHILEGYALRYPDALLTCYTNRIHPLSPQLLGGVVSENADIREHIPVAEQLRNRGFNVRVVPENMSGFLMLLSKKMWNEFKFTEDLRYLGVDSHYWKILQEHRQKILIMESLYVFHCYRLINGIKDKRHLTA